MADDARRIAAVAGGLGGIGAGIVVALTRRAFGIIVCDRTIDAAAAEELKSRVATDARLAFVEGDSAALSNNGRLVEAMFAAFGRVDCLVNHAGVSAKSRGDLLDVSVESFDLKFAVAAPGDFAESARSIILFPRLTPPSPRPSGANTRCRRRWSR